MVLLTVGWLATIVAMVFVMGMIAWAASSSDGERLSGKSFILPVAIALVAGPVVLGAVAAYLGLSRTAIAYFFLWLFCVAAALALYSRSVETADDPPVEPTRCVQYSGGHTGCPGG
jgi:hypothetical protein